MSKPYCHHINPAGVFCGAPPVKKRDYCYWHLHEHGRRMKAARARSRSERVILQMPVLDDLHAVQVALMQLGEAIAHQEIDPQSGRLLLSVLRLAASNLKSSHGWQQKSEFQTFGLDASIVIEDPNFELQYDLPKNFDLSVEPEVAFPPEKETPGSPHGPAVEMCGIDDASIPWVTADHVELMAIRQNEGEAAARKFADQLVRKDQRREHRRQRARYEEVARNQTIKLAAKKLFEDELRAGRLTPGMTPKQAWEALSQNRAEARRRPPQSDGIALEGQAVAGESGA